MTLQPCHTVLYSSQRQRGSALMHFYREKWVSAREKHKAWGTKDRSSGVWRRSGKMTALRRLSLIDLWRICLLSALLKHECVLWLFLPDDDLRDDISLPADHVTYKMSCGDLSNTHIPRLHPPCHHSYMRTAFPSSLNLISDLLIQWPLGKRHFGGRTQGGLPWHSLHLRMCTNEPMH